MIILLESGRKTAGRQIVYLVSSQEEDKEEDRKIAVHFRVEPRKESRLDHGGL